MLCLIPLCNSTILTLVLLQALYYLNSTLFIPFKETWLVCAQFDPTLGGQGLSSLYSSQDNSSAFTHCCCNTAGADMLLLYSCYALTCSTYYSSVSDISVSFCTRHSISFSPPFSLCLELCPSQVSVSLLAIMSRWGCWSLIDYAYKQKGGVRIEREKLWIEEKGKRMVLMEWKISHSDYLQLLCLIAVWKRDHHEAGSRGGRRPRRWAVQNSLPEDVRRDYRLTLYMGSKAL